MADITEALATATPASRWRMEVTERPDGVTVVNDAYNANPDSMRAALKALVAMGHGRRTWAVLGSMLGGDESVAEHDAIGRLAVRLNVSARRRGGDRQAHGQRRAARGLLGRRGRLGARCRRRVPTLSRELSTGDVVLLKSSRDAGLQWLGDRLAGPSA